MTPFLKNIRIDAFGGFTNKVIGPFSSGLTVVLGPNEAGKTTIASFVLGVLFGWETGRGSVNNYKPKNAERAGSLFFETGEGEAEIFRIKNTDGMQGDVSLVADVDKETFSTIFNLTSDELRSLKSSTDITAKLLTAGSGTESSPTQSLQQIQNMLGEYTSRAAGIDHSLINLQNSYEQVKSELSLAKESAERLNVQNKEYHDIEQQRSLLKERLAQQVTDKEEYSFAYAQIQEIEAVSASLVASIEQLEKEEEKLQSEYAAQFRKEYDCFVELSSAEERAIRVKIDALSAEEAKTQHAIVLAQNNYSESCAQYEAAIASQNESTTRSSARQRGVKIGLLVFLPLSFLVAGLPLFVHGRTIASLSFTVAGVGLILFSILLSLAAFVILLRPDKREDDIQSKVRDAQWVMLKDQKKWENCQKLQESFFESVTRDLNELGLDAAQGSIQEARNILDEAREERQTRAQYRQRRQAVLSRRKECEEDLARQTAKRVALLERCGIQEEAGNATEQINAALKKKEQACENLLESAEALNRRHGELSQILSLARTDMEFNRLKLECEQIKTRMDESKREYVKLLLAKRMLESAIAIWESKSQPEVIKQASRLLEIITDGRWVRVEMNASGNLEAIDSTKIRRSPKHLSLGTCQQLYLALRIALLMTADNVGRAIPLIADDILVNFDAKRRRGAARALVELSSVRQVILLTCHEEVLEVLREADPSISLIRI